MGITLGQIETPVVDVDDFLADNLAHDEPCRAALAIGWVRVKAWSGDEAWLQARLQRAPGVWTPSQWGEFFLPVPLTARVFDQLDALEEEAQRHYWMRTPLSSLSNETQVLERVVSHLLQAGRVTPIIHILRQAVREPKGADDNADESEAVEVVAPELIMNALEAAITHVSAQELGAIRYETAMLLDHIEKCDVPRDRLARLEWLFFGCHEHVRPAEGTLRRTGNRPGALRRTFVPNLPRAARRNRNG